METRGVHFSEGVRRGDEGSGLYLFVREDSLQSTFGGPFSAEVLPHEAFVIIAGEVGLVEFKSTGLGEGFQGDFFPGLVVFGFVGVDSAYCAPHNNINSATVSSSYLFYVKYRM